MRGGELVILLHLTIYCAIGDVKKYRSVHIIFMYMIVQA